MADYKVYRYDSILGPEFYIVLESGDELYWDDEAGEWSGVGGGHLRAVHGDPVVPQRFLPAMAGALESSLEQQYLIDL